MSEALNEIQELLTKSDANPVDLNDLLVFLPILPEEVLEKLAEAFKEQPESMKEFVANFKAKFNALAGQQDKEWDNIDNEEGDKVDDDDDIKDEGDEDTFNEDF